MQGSESNKKKIVLLDDDKFILDMYALKFTKAGYGVKAFDNVELCLKALREGYIPNAILADVVMPGMTGLEFVSKVREEKLAPGAMLIMLTNQGSSEDIAKASEAKVDNYIVKATTIPSDVLAQVEKMLSNK